MISFIFGTQFLSKISPLELTNSLEDTYDSLIACTEKCFFIKRRLWGKRLKKSTPVANARVKLREISLKYHINPSKGPTKN